MKRLLLVIGFILLVLLVLGFIAPKEYTSEREIIIDAPKAHVYSRYISSLEGLHSWRLALTSDSTSKITYKGTPGTVGSQADWVTSFRSHEGREKVMRVTPLKRIEFEIRYIKPWESLNHAQISIEEISDSQCKVISRFEGHNPFPFNIQHLFVDMDYKMGARLTKDLDNLKALAEESYLIQRLSIRREGLERRTYHVVVDSMSSIEEARTRAISKFIETGSKLKKSEIQMLANPTIMAYKLKDQTLYRVVKAVTDSQQVANSASLIEIPAGESLIAQYLGSFKHLSGVHSNLKKYLQQREQLESNIMVESYLVHPGIEGDTAKWLTNIRYLLMEKN